MKKLLLLSVILLACTASRCDDCPYCYERHHTHNCPYRPHYPPEPPYYNTNSITFYNNYQFPIYIDYDIDASNGPNYNLLKSRDARKIWPGGAYELTSYDTWDNLLRKNKMLTVYILDAETVDHLSLMELNRDGSALILTRYYSLDHLHYNKFRISIP